MRLLDKKNDYEIPAMGSTQESRYWFDLEFGHGIHKHLDMVADFRIQNFRSFPYLYAGSHEYEKEYLQGYAHEPKSLFVRAYDSHARVVGISTALPLLSSSSIVHGADEIFRRANLDPARYYYFGEIIVSEQHRGQGLARRIFEMQEKFARVLGYTHICFLTVVRESDHPSRPENYIDSDEVWTGFGFKRTNMVTIYDWPTYTSNGVKDESHLLVFWTKKIST